MTDTRAEILEAYFSLYQAREPTTIGSPENCSSRSKTIQRYSFPHRFALAWISTPPEAANIGPVERGRHVAQRR